MTTLLQFLNGPIVIASKAKQSILPHRKNGLLRRFAPRNDVAELFDSIRRLWHTGSPAFAGDDG
jgi:hypothetical protein